MGQKIICSFIAAACVTVAGCELEQDSSYGPAAGSRFGAGYSQAKLADDLYDVTFRGHGNMDYSLARHYAMRRAAEIGRELGYTHFSVEGEQNETSMKEFSYSLPTERTSYVGIYRTPITTYDEETFSEIVRFPKAVLRVRYYEGQPEGRHLEVHNVENVLGGIPR
jgi:hypothetical protein